MAHPTQYRLLQRRM